MTDLVGWLREQIDADEAAARAAAQLVSAEWEADRDTVLWWPEEGAPDDGSGAWPICPGTVLAAHIAAWDPARVLAEVAAKRSILARHEAYDRATNPAQPPIGDEPYRRAADCRHNETTLALLDLAQPYAGRPGFDPAWRLDA